MYEFSRITNGFHYVFEKKLAPGDECIVKMPPVSPNKRGINDIGWQASGDVTLFGTLARHPEAEDTLWQEIKDYDEVNKTVSALKIVCGDTPCRIIIRAILN